MRISLVAELKVNVRHRMVLILEDGMSLKEALHWHGYSDSHVMWSSARPRWTSHM